MFYNLPLISRVENQISRKKKHGKYKDTLRAIRNFYTTSYTILAITNLHYFLCNFKMTEPQQTSTYDRINKSAFH